MPSDRKHAPAAGGKGPAVSIVIVTHRNRCPRERGGGTLWRICSSPSGASGTVRPRGWGRISGFWP